MKIIISPAKKMNVDTDSLPCRGLPCFIEQTREVLAYLRGLSYEEAKRLWGCSDKLASLNYERVQHMELERNLTPALLSYEGIQYQYMAPRAFEDEEWEYVEEHLRILSGFYGVLKPFDGVVPYRLEMQARARVLNAKDLYEFWGERLYSFLWEEEKEDLVIVNLASKEYSLGVEKWVKPPARLLTVVFAEESGGKRIQKGTAAKMARGEMVRFLAEHRAKTPEKMKEFDRLGYCFEESLSKDDQWIFLKGEK